MFDATVMSCKKRSFTSKENPDHKVEGYTLAVALPGTEGWVEVWSKMEYAAGDKVSLCITEGKFHKPKVRVL